MTRNLSADSLADGWSKALSLDRKQFNMFFERMMDGFSYHKIVLDKSGKPVDYVFLEVNDAFEKMTGLKRDKIIGKRVTEVLKGIENDPADWIGVYGKVALTCEPAQFENFAEALGKWYNVSAYCPEKGYFVTIFEDITERKNAQEALRVNEERFRSVLNNSLDVVYRLNLQTRRYEYMSPASKRLLGFEPEELMNMSNKEVLSRVYPEDLPRLHAELAQIDKTGKGVSEYRFKGKDGKYTWWSNQMVVIRDKDGKPLYRDGFVRNITERKKAEQELVNAKNDWERTFDAVPDFVAILDTNYKIIRANKAMAEQLGTTPEKAVGLRCYECVHGTAGPIDFCPHAQLLKDGKEHVAEVHEPRLGGDFIVSATPLHDEKGQLIGSVHVARNITERKKAEQDLKTSEQRWSTTLSSIGDAVIATDTDGKIKFMNAVAEELTGWQLSDAKDKPIQQIFNIVNEATRREVESPITKVLEKGLVVGLANHTVLIRKDGSEIPIDDSGAPIISEEGKITGVVLVFRDITQRKKDEETLLRLNRTLRAISNSNQALMRVTDEKTFLQQACKIIVEDCGYPMVWVGIAEDNEEKTVRPIAYFGFDKEYVKSLNITWADTSRGRGPTGRAIRTGEPQFCENMQTDPLFEPWRKEASKRGFASSIALPLKSGNKVFGALTLYSKEPNVCSEDEIKLLMELASDFAHGIMLLRLRKEKEAADAQIYRQAALINLSPNAIIVRGLDGTITFWSEGAEKLYGWTKKEVIGKSTHKLFQTKFPKPIDDIMSELKAKERWTGELVHKTKNGNEVIVQSWWLAERTEHGKIISILESNVDITERKANEKEIARLASFPTLNPNPVFEVDFNGRITYANPATKIIFPELEALATKHPFLSDWSGVVKHFETGATIFFGREVKVGNHWYHQQLYYVGSVDRIRVYTVDIDELKQTEEQRAKVQVKLEENAVLLEEYASQMEELAEQRAQQLKNAERMAAIGQTAGMVGHDIRNPLQAITSDMYLITEELKSMPEGESKKSVFESIDSVNENLTYINKIVSDLQDYTRPLKPSIQEANLAELIEGTILTVSIPKRIELTTEINDNSKAIQTDVAYLRRILTNLVTNAVQAMPEEGGKLTVEALKKKDKIVICIEDTGVGIPMELKDKMFTPLFTTKSKGQGLGLAVVKRLVEALKGTITFESEPNKGTKFIVELPQTQLQPQNPK